MEEIEGDEDGDSSYGEEYLKNDDYLLSMVIFQYFRQDDHKYIEASLYPNTYKKHSSLSNPQLTRNKYKKMSYCSHNKTKYKR